MMDIKCLNKENVFQMIFVQNNKEDTIRECSLNNAPLMFWWTLLIEKMLYQQEYYSWKVRLSRFGRMAASN